MSTPVPIKASPSTAEKKTHVQYGSTPKEIVPIRQRVSKINKEFTAARSDSKGFYYKIPVLLYKKPSKSTALYAVYNMAKTYESKGVNVKALNVENNSVSWESWVKLNQNDSANIVRYVAVTANNSYTKVEFSVFGPPNIGFSRQYAMNEFNAVVNAVEGLKGSRISQDDIAQRGSIESGLTFGYTIDFDGRPSIKDTLNAIYEYIKKCEQYGIRAGDINIDDGTFSWTQRANDSGNIVEKAVVTRSNRTTRVNISINCDPGIALSRDNVMPGLEQICNAVDGL